MTLPSLRYGSPEEGRTGQKEYRASTQGMKGWAKLVPIPLGHHQTDMHSDSLGYESRNLGS